MRAIPHAAREWETVPAKKKPVFDWDRSTQTSSRWINTKTQDSAFVTGNRICDHIRNTGANRKRLSSIARILPGIRDARVEMVGRIEENLQDMASSEPGKRDAQCLLAVGVDMVSTHVPVTVLERNGNMLRLCGIRTTEVSRLPAWGDCEYSGRPNVRKEVCLPNSSGGSMG